LGFVNQLDKFVRKT